MKIFYSISLLVFTMNSYADTNFNVSMLSENIRNSSELGTVKVEGLVNVSLVARKTGNQLVIFANDQNDKVIGKAETVVGLKETPIFVLTPEGLKKITIFWGVNSN